MARFAQAPLATPNERSRRPRSLKVGVHHHDEPMKLYDGEQDDFVGPMDAMWSSYYRNTKRTPDETFPAPWVVAHCTRRQTPSQPCAPTALQ